MPTVRLANLTKRYGKITAIERINLQVHDREYISIIGPSGCGKTTMIKCIAGLIEPTEGEIYIDGKLVNDVPIQDRGIGYVFQEIALFPHMDVYGNVSYGPVVKGWSQEKMRKLVEEMLNLVSLSDRVKDYPSELSGGARQKAAVARALSSGSLLLLFDEPLGSLDTKVRAVLRRELRKMVKDLGLTAIHVTHDQEEAMAISDRIVIMKAGRIVEIGKPLELYLRPKNLFTANFLGEANFITGETVKSGGEEFIVRFNGKQLILPKEMDPESRDVVVAIRPEFVRMKKTGKSSDPWTGKVENKIFIGSTIRYNVKLNSGELIIVKYPAEERGGFNVGDNVKVRFPPEHVLVYPYPEEGLEKRISIE